jgi:hypothetical protein
MFENSTNNLLILKLFNKQYSICQLVKSIVNVGNNFSFNNYFIIFYNYYNI